MNITERAARVLQQIDAALALAKQATPGPWECVDDANNHWGKVEVKGPRVRVMGFTQATDVSFEQGIVTRADRDFIAASRTRWPASLRCLKTAIEGMLPIAVSETCADEAMACNHPFDASDALTTLCDQWEASRK